MMILQSNLTTLNQTTFFEAAGKIVKIGSAWKQTTKSKFSMFKICEMLCRHNNETKEEVM